MKLTTFNASIIFLLAVLFGGLILFSVLRYYKIVEGFNIPVNLSDLTSNVNGVSSITASNFADFNNQIVHGSQNLTIYSSGITTLPFNMYYYFDQASGSITYYDAGWNIFTFPIASNVTGTGRDKVYLITIDAQHHCTVSLKDLAPLLNNPSPPGAVDTSELDKL